MRLTILSLLCGAAAIIPVGAQSVLSVHSGVVHYVEGDAFIGDKAVELKFGQFPNIPEGQNFRTEAGRAEILLTPGSFLRLAENSEIRMVSTHLSDTRIELLKGEIAVESVDSTKDSASAAVKGNSITVLFQGSTTTLLKAGLYDFTADPGRVKVYEGEANVKVATDELLLKKGKETGLNSALLAEKFDPKVGDELIRWSSRRSGYLAMANVNAARSLSNDNGLYNNYLGTGYGPGGWAFNPAFGMYSYVPFGGVGFDPFGYSFYSPYSVFYSPFGYGYPFGYGFGGYGYYPSGYFGGGGTVASSGGVYQRNPFRSGGIGGGLRNPVITRPTGTTARAAFRTGSGEGGHSSFGGGGGLSPTTASNTLSSTSSHASSGFGSVGGGGHAGGGGGHH